MNLTDLETTLPWGLHDAYLERLDIDWMKRTLVLDMRLMMSEHQDMDQRARITITGLAYCAIDPPVIDPERGYEPTPAAGLWIIDGPGAANEDAASRLPKTPDGCFLHRFFVREWNRFIHICGGDAELMWLEPEPVAARADTRALFAGDSIPDPE